MRVHDLDQHDKHFGKCQKRFLVPSLASKSETLKIIIPAFLGGVLFSEFSGDSIM